MGVAEPYYPQQPEWKVVCSISVAPGTTRWATNDELSVLDWDARWQESLEARLAVRPGAIDDVRVWLCGEDEVVASEEHGAAVRALGAAWPTETAERWGHFPYLDAPGPWIGALQAAGV